MKIIVVNKRHGNTRSFHLGGWSKALLSACIIGLPIGATVATVKYLDATSGSDIMTPQAKEAWRKSLNAQAQQIDEVKQHTDQNITALTMRVAELQARLMRIDALGERLTDMASLDKGEFNFSVMPAVGGPEQNIEGESHAAPLDFMNTLDMLSRQIEDRQQQLDTLEAMLESKKLQREVFIAGRPIKKGWMSSRFGRRTDPFSGRVAWHNGVDFAGKDGSEIVAVASGVVTWASSRHGYGQLVEISHGNGYKTRYGHCKDILAKAGDVVKKGQIVALMGSSGRSTGPHVHFEVFKNGRTVDPSTYIHRSSR